MSRHGVTYKPGGSIAKTFDLDIKMQRVMPAAELCPTCEPKPTGLFWHNPETGKFDLTVTIGSVENVIGVTTPVPSFFYAAHIDGDLCGLDNEVVITAAWPYNSFHPNIWTFGNILIVSPSISNGVMGQCDPGILTVTATLDGVQIGDPITLVITLAGGYY